jgi:hypothetical protein
MSRPLENKARIEKKPAPEWEPAFRSSFQSVLQRWLFIGLTAPQLK